MPKPYVRKPFTYIHLPPDFCPKYSTLREACSYARHGLWQGHEKIKQGRWKAFKDGRRTVIVFASVIADEERLIAGGKHPEPVEPVVEKRRPGRPRKSETATATAAE
jgi:hypothetical protein